MTILSRVFKNIFIPKKVSKLPKILVILGPTASGKTDLSLALAKKFDGEVVNADSRQVYQEMDIGTAKPAGEWGGGQYMVAGVAHHLMDIVSPDTEFTLANFKERAQLAVADILERGKLPIVVGGTGLYIWSLVDNLEIPSVAPDIKLRAQLEEKSLEELVEMLKKIDPESAEIIDIQNSRRVLRALEVAFATGESFVGQQKKGRPFYNVLQIGVSWPRAVLYDRINDRVDQQIASGLLDETIDLAKKYSWSLPSMSGIGYRQLGYFLRGEMSLSEVVEILKRDTRRYAKRQETWFKRDKRICWIDGADQARAEKLINKFKK